MILNIDHGTILMNIANSGVFSSDRTIAEYAKDIWFKG